MVTQAKTVRAAISAIACLACGIAAGQLSDSDIAELQARALEEGWTFSVGRNAATEQPLEQLCGVRLPRNWPAGVRVVKPARKAVLRASFDWRALGGCTAIKDQNPCGACWAFATVGAVECNILIKDGVEEDLAEQWLLDCNQESMNCDGGWLLFDYFIPGRKTDPCGGYGAVLESDLPYTAIQGACGCPYPHSYEISGWASIRADVSTFIPEPDDVKRAIMDYGPVAVAVYVDTVFQAYDSGVFNACAVGVDYRDVNHAVLLVGWDDSRGTDGVWIVRNSWNTSWGEDGYMYIEYGCSLIGVGASYAEYAGQGSLLVTPLVDLYSSGVQGGPFTPRCQTYTLTNTGATPLAWSVSTTQPWLDVSRTSGTLGGGGSVDVSFCVNANANALALGQYTDVIFFRNESTSATTPRAFTLAVSEPVDFPDPHLDAAVRAAIGKPTGAILRGDLVDTGFELLEAPSAGIAGLTGLEYCTDLTSIDLSDNSLSDLSALAALTRLVSLDLSFNAITQLTPLAGLTTLVSLNVAGNGITDIGPLASLTRLSWLALGRNQIADVGPLTGLTHLSSWLDLSYNEISNLMPLAGLTQLANADLSFNQVAHLTALTGLTALRRLSLAGNEFIADVSPLANLDQLTQLALARNSIADLGPLQHLTLLTELGIERNQVADLAPLAGLTGLSKLYASVNQVADLSPLVANTGLNSGDAVDVQGNPLSDNALCTQIPALEARGLDVTYTGTCPGGTGEDDLPTAAFSASPTSGVEPLSVQFVDLSQPGSADITQWRWDFGDGSTSAQSAPRHTFYQNGYYTVTLAVTTALGSDNEAKSRYITVNDPPPAPPSGPCGTLDKVSSGDPSDGRVADVFLLALMATALLLATRRSPQRFRTR